LNIFGPLLSYKNHRGAISCHLYNWTRLDARSFAVLLKPLPSSLLHLLPHAHPKKATTMATTSSQKAVSQFTQQGKGREILIATFQFQPVIPRVLFRTTTAFNAKQWHLSPNGSTRSSTTSKWSPRMQASPKRQSFFSSWDTSLSSIRCCVGWELAQSLVNPHHTQEKWSFS
jgi:hypothetical protein